MNKVELFVNGNIYDGWLNVSIKRSVKAVSGSFDISVTNTWTQAGKAWFISPLDACTLKIDGETIITGIVDRISSSFDAGNRTINISGRDLTADIVDSSYTGPAEISGVTFLEFVKKVAKPFGVNVIAEVATPSEKAKFSAQQGETAFNFLERAARLRGFLLGTDTKGNLVISKIGSTRAGTALIEGKNLLSGSLAFDGTERFNHYVVLGQRSGGFDGESETDASVFSSMRADAYDQAVPRHRHLVITAEGSITPQLARERAQYEAITRAAKSSRINVKVKGWRQADGALWKINQLVAFESQYFNIKRDLLIADITYSQGDDGTTCEMGLEREDAYRRDPGKIEKSSKYDLWADLNSVQRKTNVNPDNKTPKGKHD